MSQVSFVKPSAAEQPKPVIDVETTVQTTEIPAADVKVENITTVATLAPVPEPAPTPAPTAPPLQPQPQPQPKLVVAKTSGIPLGDYLPDFTDVIFPRLNIVQKVGELSNVYPHGSLVLNQNNQFAILYETAVCDATGKVIKEGQPPLGVILMGFKPNPKNPNRPVRFVERVEGGARGQIFDTEEEVVKNGGTTNWQEWELKKAAGIRLFQPYCEGLVAIEKPVNFKDDDGIIFGYEADGKRLAVALWGMKGTAYTHAAKSFFTARQMGCLRGGYPTFSYSLSTRLQKFKANFAFVPVCLPCTKTTETMLEFVRSIIQG